MTPTFLSDKLVRMHYSTYSDELLHQESSGVAILYDLQPGLKMVLPDAYNLLANDALVNAVVPGYKDLVEAIYGQ